MQQNLKYNTITYKINVEVLTEFVITVLVILGIIFFIWRVILIATENNSRVRLFSYLNKKSNKITNDSSMSFPMVLKSGGYGGSNSPRPPKKNWKEKLKEHFSKYKYIYISTVSTGILILGTILWFKSGVPPSDGSNSLDSSSRSIGTIKKSLPSIENPFTGLSNKLNELKKTYTLFDIHNTIQTIAINNDNFIFKYKYFLIFGFSTTIYAAYQSIDLQLLPFLLTSNYIDMNLFQINRNVGSLSTIGYMHGHMQLIEFLIRINDHLTSLDNTLININFTYNQFYYEYVKLITYLISLGIPSSVLGLYFPRIVNQLQVTEEIQLLINRNLFNLRDYQFLLDEIDKALDTYLISILEENKSLDEEELLFAFKDIIKNIILNYEGTGLAEEVIPQFLNALLFIILENYLLHHECFDIIHNESNFNQFITFYFKTLKILNLPELNNNQLYTFLFQFYNFY